MVHSRQDMLQPTPLPSQPPPRHLGSRHSTSSRQDDEEMALLQERRQSKLSDTYWHRLFIMHRSLIIGACVALLILLSLMSKVGRLSALFGTTPQPPAPYNYDSFLEWFGSLDWNNVDLKMTPHRDWFDAELAIKQHPQFFQGEDMAAALQAAHSMNRFRFMQGIMKTGDDSMQSSMAMHLLILRLVQESLLRKQAVVLDAGCGNGALLRLMALLGSQGGFEIKPIGFDLLAENVEQARRLLAVEEHSAPGAPASHIFQANIFDPAMVRRGFQLVGVQDAHEKAVVDVIVVGGSVLGSKAGRGLSRDEMALETSKEAPLQALAEMLRPQGLLLVPVCKDTQIKEGKCMEDIILLKKDDEGHMEVVRGGVSDKDFLGAYTLLTPANGKQVWSHI